MPRTSYRGNPTTFKLSLIDSSLTFAQFRARHVCPEAIEAWIERITAEATWSWAKTGEVAPVSALLLLMLS
jgi:hypothetical protein